MAIKKSTRYVFIALIVSLALIQPIQAKVFTRCQLTRELLKQSFSRTFISNWVCLIEHESDRNTSKLVQKSNGSFNYGLFQLNSKKYCKIGRKGGDCNLECESLLNDDISDDSRCAQKIFELEGFKSWPLWVKKCKGSRLPDVEKCPDFSEPSRPVKRNVNHSSRLG